MVILDENMLSLPDQAVVVPLDLVCVPIGGKQLSRWLEVYSRCRIARSEIQRSIQASRPDLGHEICRAIRRHLGCRFATERSGASTLSWFTFISTVMKRATHVIIARERTSVKEMSKREREA